MTGDIEDEDGRTRPFLLRAKVSKRSVATLFKIVAKFPVHVMNFELSVFVYVRCW